MKLFASEVDSALAMERQASHVPALRQAGRDFSDDFATLLDRLAAAGLPQVGVVDMQEPPFPVAVVRVVIPGLEGIHTFPSYTPGPRARAAAGGQP
jgi:ribosomal protein S12 methylthiotransferase accessory factor